MSVAASKDWPLVWESSPAVVEDAKTHGQEPSGASVKLGPMNRCVLSVAFAALLVIMSLSCPQSLAFRVCHQRAAVAGRIRSNLP